MFDLSILAGISKPKKIQPKNMSDSHREYLYHLGIDVWCIRDDNQFKKPLLLIDSSTDLGGLSNRENLLLGAMLSSIGLSMEDIVLKIITEQDLNEDQLIDNRILSRSSLIVTMGYSVGDWLKKKCGFIDNKYIYHDLPVFFVSHPNYLLSNSADKKRSYFELVKIREISGS
ncbi:MAG: hypothetical protein P1U74_05125 [Legionellaceae bacterium]|nr:hypothetical protein [Legionellaceae bacterium]